MEVRLGQEQLIETVVVGIEDDAEMALQARQQLGVMVVQDATDEELVRSSQRVASAGWKRWRKGWMIVVLVFSLPLVVTMSLKLSRSIGQVRGSINPMLALATHEPNAYPDWAQHLSSRERLVLFGAEGAMTEVERWKPLWESDRENPLYFQEYATAYLVEHDSLPPGFLATAAAIDPGNGWYAMIAASHDSESVVKRESIPTSDRDAGVAAPYQVLDADELKKRMARLHEATRGPRFASHRRELAAERFKLMPAAGDYTEMVQAYAIWADMRIDTSAMDLTHLISAEAQRCQKDGDREGFVELVGTWETLLDASLEQAGSLVEVLLAQSILTGTSPSMRDAASSLELNGESWGALETAVRERKQALEKAKRANSVITQHGSMLGSLSLPTVGRFAAGLEPLTPQELLPSTRVEQALLGRVMCASGWQLMGLVLLVSLLVMLSVPKLVRTLGLRLQGLYRPVDWMWIMLSGVLGPLVVFLIFRYATPFSRLDWGPRLTLYLIPVGHFISLLIMWLTWPVVIAAWRLESASTGFDWTLRKRFFAGLVLALPPVAMVLLGCGVPMGGHSLALLGISVLAGLVCLGWLAFRPGCGSQGGVGGKLQRTVISYAVRPAWLGAMLGFALLIPFFQLEERRWMKRDEVLKPTSSMSAFEGRVTEQAKKEIRDLLEAHPVN